MRTIMNSPEQRQIVWDRKLAQMDYDTQMESALRKGQMDTLIGLVNDGLLSLGDAAKRADLSVKDFAQQAGVKLPT